MPSYFSKCLHDDCDEIAHTWDKSCTTSSITVGINCFKYAIQLYAPLYTATALLTGKRKEYFLRKLWKEILQSSLFLGCNGGTMVFFFCLIRRILGKFYIPSVGFLPGVLSSFCSVLIERKSRRGPLAIYMLNQALDTSFNILKLNGYVKEVQYGEVMLFSGVVAALMYMYRSNNLPDGFVKNLIKKGLQEEKTPTDSNAVHVDHISYFKQSCHAAGRAFCVGYGIQVGYNLLLALSSFLKKPEKLFFALWKKANFKFGAFLASLVGLYKLTERLLEKYKRYHIDAFVAGGVAGISMVFQRSSYITLYLVSKTFELFYMNGIEKGFFPYVKHFDTILYALCTGLMFHGAVLQPLYLKPRYYSFLLKLTGNKFMAMNRERLDVFGFDSSRIDRINKEMLQTKK